MFKNFDSALAVRLIVHFLVGWPVVAFIGRILEGVTWFTAIVGGFVLTGLTIIISMFAVLNKRNNEDK